MVTYGFVGQSILDMFAASHSILLLILKFIKIDQIFNARAVFFKRTYMYCLIIWLYIPFFNRIFSPCKIWQGGLPAPNAKWQCSQCSGYDCTREFAFSNHYDLHANSVVAKRSPNFASRATSRDGYLLRESLGEWATRRKAPTRQNLFGEQFSKRFVIDHALVNPRGRPSECISYFLDLFINWNF